jgi:hypothetical protein
VGLENENHAAVRSEDVRSFPLNFFEKLIPSALKLALVI